MSELLTRWHKLTKRTQWLIAIGVIVGFVALIGSFSNGSSESTNSSSTASAASSSSDSSSSDSDPIELANDPMSCLDGLELSNVEQRSSRYWRGNYESTFGPFYQIGVALLPTKAEARRSVADATDVYAEQSGRYMVTGPLKPSAEGAGLTFDEGRLASTQVQAVAACLGG